MGINALLAGLLCMTLPETKGMPTAETVDSEEGAEEAYVALQVGILLRLTKETHTNLLVCLCCRVRVLCITADLFRSAYVSFIFSSPF